MAKHPTRRALGAEVWGRKAARLPDEGVLLVCTDLQGNLADYEAMKQLYLEEDRAGNRPVLAFCGDLVHGPSPAFLAMGRWPAWLGSPYPDGSPELLRDFERFTRVARAFSLMGNHEHAHVGGPRVGRFHPDEAAALERELGPDTNRMRDFMRSFPLIAVGRCGVVLSHAAPLRSERDLAAFEALRFDGYESVPLYRMADQGTVGALLWARSCSPAQASALLKATSIDGDPSAFVVHGHEVVPEGYERTEPTHICVSTSYAVPAQCKAYLRLDLSRRYQSVNDLREGEEIRWLYREQPSEASSPLPPQAG